MDTIQIAAKGAFPKKIGEFVQPALIPFMLLKESQYNFLFYIHLILFLFEFKIQYF